MKEKATIAMKNFLPSVPISTLGAMAIALSLSACSTKNDVVTNYYDDGIYHDPSYGDELLSSQLNVEKTNRGSAQGEYDYYDPNDVQSQSGQTYNNSTVTNNYYGSGYYGGMRSGWYQPGVNLYFGFGYSPWYNPYMAFYDPFYSPWGWGYPMYYGWAPHYHYGWGWGYPRHRHYGYWGSYGYNEYGYSSGSQYAGNSYRGPTPSRYGSIPVAQAVGGAGRLSSPGIAPGTRDLVASSGKGIRPDRERGASKLRELPAERSISSGVGTTPRSRDHIPVLTPNRERPQNTTPVVEGRQPTAERERPRLEPRIPERRTEPTPSRARPSRATEPTRTYERPNYVPEPRTRERTAPEPRERRATPSRSTSPSRGTMPSRSTTPSRRSDNQSGYAPPARSHSSPSPSATPSRSTSPSRSATPSRSTSPSRSSAPRRF